MAKVTWSLDPKQMITRVEGLVTKRIDQTKDEVYIIADEAAGDIVRTIITSVTPWGERRVAGLVPGPAGPSRPDAGRIETGHMMDEVTVDVIEDTQTSFVVEAGWQNPKKYFLEQEHGTAKIKGMGALHDAWMKATMKMKNLVKGLK